MKTRIGIVTGGGDCPGLHAVIRAVAKAAAWHSWECAGNFARTARALGLSLGD